VALAHPQVVRDSAQAYAAYLDQSIGSGRLRSPGQEAAHALRDSIQNLLQAPDRPWTANVWFAAAMLARCDANDRATLVNQWALGIGNDAAPVIVMGTEHAYDVDKSPAGLALESCASVLLWLADGGPELARWIAQDDTWVKGTGGRAYHRHPSDHYRVASGQTWSTVARVLGVPLEELGELSYQVERSAHPARAASRGAPPTRERLAFLVGLLRTFRTSARVLILHGKTHTASNDWAACNRSLTMTFLDQAVLSAPETLPIGMASIRRWTNGDRTVFHTWALNRGALARSGAPDAYEDQLAKLVASALQPQKATTLEGHTPKPAGADHCLDA